MAWFFEGTGSQLGLSISTSGVWSAYGSCSQECRPSAGDFDIYNFVSGVEGVWSLHSTQAAEHEYDGAGRGLKGLFARDETRAAAIVQYYDKDGARLPAVSASILVPASAMAEMLKLFRSIIGRGEIKYVIALEFAGFRRPDVIGPDIPSVAEFVHPEFLKRRAYLSEGVSISVVAK